MRLRFRVVAAVALMFTAGMLLTPTGAARQTAKPGPPLQVGDYQLSGPYTHDNLTIFLVHGPDRFKGRKYLMLAEALQKKLFVIYETQSVNQLKMENLSNEEVLILSGDILKGGQQDRIAQFDQLVPPKSGKLPLTVFCVEHTAGRWMRKLTEEDKTFTSSPGQICSNSLRLANRYAGSQHKVWLEVANAQKSLSHNAGTDVKSKESESSLALSLKAKEVQAAVDRYVAGLAPIVRDKNNVVGFAFAVNGKVYSADVYGSPSIFQKVWPRLVRACALEAFADRLPKDKTFPTVTASAVQRFLEEGNKGKASAPKDVGKEIRQVTNDADRVIRFESQQGPAGAALPLRQSYEKKK
jgi:hypothetical protein